MTDKEWYELSNRNYEAQAARLVSEGWERRDWIDSIIPATFHKGDRVLYLITDFGNPNWWPVPLPQHLRALR